VRLLGAPHPRLRVPPHQKVGRRRCGSSAHPTRASRVPPHQSGEETVRLLAAPHPRFARTSPPKWGGDGAAPRRT
jgi:hypothetical protein